MFQSKSCSCARRDRCCLDLDTMLYFLPLVCTSVVLREFIFGAHSKSGAHLQASMDLSNCTRSTTRSTLLRTSYLILFHVPRTTAFPDACTYVSANAAHKIMGRTRAHHAFFAVADCSSQIYKSPAPPIVNSYWTIVRLAPNLATLLDA